MDELLCLTGDRATEHRCVQLVLRDSLRQEPIFPGRRSIVGNFVRVTSDSVFIRPNGAAEFSIAKRVITSARASRGVSRVRSALSFGVGIGATVLSVRQVAWGIHDDHRNDNTLAFGAIGFRAGFLIGAVSPYEQWRGVRR